MPDLYHPENRQRAARFVTQSRFSSARGQRPTRTGAIPWLPGIWVFVFLSSS
jgi:hypothetical protein